MDIARSLAGLCLFLLIGVIFSTDRRAIRPRVVLAALALQVAIGALVLLVPPGRALLHATSNVVNTILNCGQAGAAFLFGALVSPHMDTVFPDGGFIFAFRVLPQIIYVSALIAVLYHVGIMQRVAAGLGTALRVSIGTTVAESFAAVMTIFVGQSEMPVVVAPYLPRMTRSEVFTVMASGTASVSGSVLAGYAGLGVPMEFLLAASFMAIPGGLLFARLLMPESEAPQITDMRDAAHDGHSRASTVFEAIAIGAAAGLKVAASVAAMLIAFIGLITLGDTALSALGRGIGHPGLSLASLLGVAFAPLAWLLGVDWAESGIVGTVIGQKLVFNEFVAYVTLSPLIHHAALSARSIAITTVALCGFSNLSSIGVLIGAFSGVAPEQRGWVASQGARAVLAGMLSNLTSAVIAGLFLA